MSVRVVDPNDKIINNGNGVENATPDYENMIIYAELTGTRRGHSEIILSSNNGTTTNNTDSFTIGFLGYDNNTNQYTTNWSNNIQTSETTQFEGLGITDIKIKMNSSYIPQVNITMVDIRGMCIFNNSSNNSPYRMLFDFPPALFTLKVKGYYGKMLEYKLHLVRNNQKFDGKTGNYVIEVEFIANTFAPLTDILFKYVEMIPLMYNTNNITNNDNKIPTNTHELISKLSSLYSNVNGIIKNSKELTTITSNKEKIKNNQELLSNLNNVDNYVQLLINDTKYKGNKNTITLLKTDIDKISEISLSNYSNLTNNSVKSIENRRLLIGLRCNGNTINNSSIGTYIPLGIDSKVADDYNLTSGYLKQLKKSLINSFNGVTEKKSGITEDYVLYDNVIYNCIDISEYYIKLVSSNKLLNDEIGKNEEIVNTKIDSIAIKEIGMVPTVYNIFKILCDDVDIMFDNLRQVCREAIEHHNNPANISKFRSDINSTELQSAQINGRVQPFPKFMELDSSIGGRDQTLVQTYPDVNKFDYIPEMRFVDDFINVFFKTKQIDVAKKLKSEKDDSGEGLWYPISPIDSANGDNPNYQPYSDYNDISGIPDNSVTTKILDTFLNRYYLLTQYIYSDGFYKSGNINNSAESQYLIDLFSDSEALNISLSITDKKVIDNLIENIKNSNNDYTKLFANTPSYKTDSNSIKLGSVTYYNNSSDVNYKGIKIFDETIDIKDLENSSDKISTFIKSNNSWKNIFYLNFKDYDDAQPTKDNLIFFDDNQINKSNYDSRYFNLTKSSVVASDLVTNSTFVNIISDNNSNVYLKQYMVLSSNGQVLTPDSSRLSKLFTTPSILGIPTSVLSYYGFLNILINNSSILGDVNSGLDILISGATGEGNRFASLVLKEKLNNDIIYFKTIDNNTRTEFENIYTIFINDEYDEIVKNMIDLSESYTNDISTTKLTNLDNKLKIGGEYEKSIITPMMSKKNLMIYNDKTFKPNNSIINYKSLSTLDSNTGNTIYKSVNNKFMINFIGKLKNYLVSTKQKQETKIDDFNKSINDKDIKSQLYYSFKNIVDKWINGSDLNISGYPMNNDTKKSLIDHFVFVDRSMNDISGKPIVDNSGNSSTTMGCVINAQTLIDIKDDNDINMFSVFSRILSQNGFEFFPLQNFMMFDQTKDWNDVFSINSDLNIKPETTPGFVCMLIGGTSTTLDTGNGYLDDGILDLEKADGFGNVVENSTSNISSGNINVFKVSFGKQNQSIFKDIAFDTKEFPETNESLSILGQLAGDNGTASPIPKGQNLYKTYEKRAYGCKISSMGNVMLQPTQYFQVENIAMYSGAYILLNVEHNINSNNYMSTEFSGTRILKYPHPIVTSFSTSVGLQTNGSYLTTGDFTNNGGMGIVNPNDPNTIPTQMKGDSYYKVKI